MVNEWLWFSARRDWQLDTDGDRDDRYREGNLRG